MAPKGHDRQRRDEAVSASGRLNHMAISST